MKNSKICKPETNTISVDWFLSLSLSLSFFISLILDICCWEDGLFYYTNNAQTDVVVRKKEVYDGATPSGNAIITACLKYLGVILIEKKVESKYL